MKIEALKDGKGNVIITEGSFEHLLNCLDNQKYITSTSDIETQNIIDTLNKECREILNRKYVLNTTIDGYLLYKKYENQHDINDWEAEEVYLIDELFKIDLLPLDGTESIKSNTTPIGKTIDGWIITSKTYIERPLRFDNMYLTISDDGTNLRPWTQDEIIKISNLLNK